MGAYQSRSKPDMYMLMVRGDVEVCAIGLFSTLEKAKEHTAYIGAGRKMWIEKWQIDDPSYYEEEKEYVVWKN